jgi:hypothetical protein
MSRWGQAVKRGINAAALDRRPRQLRPYTRVHPLSTQALFPLAKTSTHTRTHTPSRIVYQPSNAPAPTARQHRSHAFSGVAYSPEEGRGGGLFGVTGLDTASDFPRLAIEAAAEVEHLLVLAVEGEAAGHIRGRALVQLLDQMSDSVCLVMDAAELCRSAHPDAEWKRGAQAAYSILAQLVARLNMVNIFSMPRENTGCSSICFIGYRV